MVKSARELAFIRDLFITEDWTRRFTELADKHIKLNNLENLVYLNAGTGAHCLALRESLDEATAIFGSCENSELLTIARDKAAAVSSDVDFSDILFEDGSFDAVIADASMVRPGDLPGLIEESVRVARAGAIVAVMTPSAGSFGEIFSLMWEVLFNEGLGGGRSVVEDLISEIPTVSHIERMAESVGLIGVETHSSNEIFEFKNGEGFIASPLVSEFLLPVWLRPLKEDEAAAISEKLAGLIDAEDGPLTFRFSVKATLLTGEKQ
jgi:ubiquinone/menaquinone biosynthesis C-methylase UbiE